MYKIFNENKALICPKISENDVLPGKDITINDETLLKYYVDVLLNWLNNSDIDLVSEDITDVGLLSSALLSVFKMAPAAGGVVCRDGGIVSIVRNGIYDLPKGHIERGEIPMVAALREVEEETGIRCQKVIAELPSTWHCYKMNGDWLLKHTYWYAMETDALFNPIPQHEEGITQVKMIFNENVNAFLSGTYRSLGEILGPSIRTFVTK